MGKLRTFTKIVAAGAAIDVGVLLYATRASEVRPVPPNDPIYASAAHRAFNPQRNPPMHDIVQRRLPLREVRDDLRAPQAPPGRLVEAFCGGVFGGAGESKST